jgi:hypothetical protein
MRRLLPTIDLHVDGAYPGLTEETKAVRRLTLRISGAEIGTGGTIRNSLRSLRWMGLFGCV